ncbi:MAG: hypothetical protein HDS62_06470 [Bacteroidales bacterium]|nr:hypothetical protein [Bacteroidales bacterium]MDE6236349.1 hypothetical protein [Muribaculaceae bacterium]MDE6537310.1 hypothetical protein [Muribaculaceae bacterium]
MEKILILFLLGILFAGAIVCIAVNSRMNHSVDSYSDDILSDFDRKAFTE